MRILIIEDNTLFQYKIMKVINEASELFKKEFNQVLQTEVVLISTVADAYRLIGDGSESPLNSIIISDYNLPDGSATKIWENCVTSYFNNTVLIAVSTTDINNEKLINSWRGASGLKVSIPKQDSENFEPRLRELILDGMKKIDYIEEFGWEII